MHRKQYFLHSFSLALLYAVVFLIAQFFLCKVGIFTTMPTSVNLIYWDAGWYHGIAENGYTTLPDTMSTGFFMLFPLIWKITHLGVWGIVTLNILFYAFSIAVLTMLYPVPTKQKLLWLSLPSCYFMFVPYTEALFFLLSTTLLYGISKKNTLIIIVSLFMLSMTRATAVFLLPALLVMALVCNDRRDWLKNVGRYLALYALPLVLGLLAFLYYQYQATGIWNAYFKTQRQLFGHVASLPGLPLISHEGARLLWLGALAMLADAAALIMAAVIFCKWLFKNQKQSDPLFVLSLAYLSMVLLQIVFVNPKTDGSTVVMGIHRYSIASAYFPVFLYYVINKFRYRPVHFLAFILFANVVWLLFGSYVHIQTLLFFNVLTLYATGYLFAAGRKNVAAYFLLFAINLCIQLHMFQQYISMLYTD